MTTMPDYMQNDGEVTAMLTTRDYAEYRRLIGEYPHPDDQDALTVAWNAGATIARREAVSMRCGDCGAYGHTDRRGLGISCGCAAE